MVAPYAEPEKGAAIVRVSSYSKYFTEQGHDVRVLAPKRAGVESSGNVTRYKSIREMMGLVRKGPFDIVMATSPPITHAFFAGLAAKLSGKPFVLDSKDIFTQSALKLKLVKEKSLKMHAYRFMEKQAHVHADKVLTLDADIGDWIVEHYRVPRERVTVAANGVDLDIVYRDEAAGQAVRERLGISADAVVAIYFGGLGDERYIQFLEENISAISKENVFVLFVIAFDGSPRAHAQLDEILETVKRLGLEKHFLIEKNIPHADVRGYLSAADVGVDFWGDLPFFAVPVKVLEYMACGLPVIVKAPPGNQSFRKFFDRYDAGFCSDDWKAFSDAFAHAVDDIAAFSKKGEGCINIIKNEYTRKATNRKVLGIFSELLTKGGKNP
jgi:glycosyltransferase involved in cell wall biosynthesis